MTRQLAVENLFAAIEHQRAVFRDEGDPICELRKEGDELVILVAAGDNKFNAALLNIFWKSMMRFARCNSDREIYLTKCAE